MRYSWNEGTVGVGKTMGRAAGSRCEGLTGEGQENLQWGGSIEGDEIKLGFQKVSSGTLR